MMWLLVQNNPFAFFLDSISKATGKQQQSLGESFSAGFEDGIKILESEIKTRAVFETGCEGEMRRLGSVDPGARIGYNSQQNVGSGGVDNSQLLETYCVTCLQTMSLDKN